MNYPEIGRIYPFYDDDKVSESRQYAALVTRIVPYSDIKDRSFYHYTTKSYKRFEEIFKYEVNKYDYLYAKESKFIVECAIPEYDEHLIYFVKTVDDRLFSINIQSNWQSGFLDVNNINKKYLLTCIDLKIIYNKL